MKSSAHQPFYFSAYPLKSIPKELTQSSGQKQSPYLRSILSGKSKTVSRVRVFPMVNPYGKTIVPPKRVKTAAIIEPAGKEWFNHYE
jgi:hypothetical protein